MPATHAQRSIFSMPFSRLLFSTLRRREAWHLSRGGPTIWVPSPSGTILTSVVRVPDHLGARLREAVLPAGDAHGGHYVYPVGDLHVTLTNLDAYRDVPVERIEEALTDCLSRVGPVELSLRGLAISRATVFAQVHASPAWRLFRLRAAVRRTLTPSAGAIPGRPADMVGFCNVLRFRHRDIAPAKAIVAGHRDIEIGRFLLDDVEIVRTDKVLSAANTAILAKCARRSP
ncbi:hypothetical protein Acsp03_31470 [Actinomadura sp. NBRC 104412]|uniref:2'-5' RNA ligase family protein n=1 Tax=Actinomadura sp. NBRC 104412 TaxID=3032203 RepID=UPI0024A4B479|nr:2'-5' RNA ligase family protein [Actinomadura sp. NBRC 104412]GLZ05681.1 hypothetical protein Acsp03_31470 [Actinomadura sp. NBRC 104412]